MATDNSHTTADTPEKIADWFNKCFTSVFSNCQSEKEESGFEQWPTIQPVINDIVLHVSEVEAVPKSLDPNKAACPDEILARMLKETAATITPSLCTLFNRSLEEGYIPREWKLANEVHVHKKDEKDHVENYRQFEISLLCIVLKFLERCVLNRKQRLEELIVDCQHGFRCGRS